jgi:hypothetical protein
VDGARGTRPGFRLGRPFMQATNAISIPANTAGQIEAVITLTSPDLNAGVPPASATSEPDRLSDWDEFSGDDFDTRAPLRCSPLDDF